MQSNLLHSTHFESKSKGEKNSLTNEMETFLIFRKFFLKKQNSLEIKKRHFNMSKKLLEEKEKRYL